MMPYISQEKRESLNKYYEKMKEVVKTNEDLTNLLLCISGAMRYAVPSEIQDLSDHMTLVAYPDGGLNYILFKYAKYDVTPSYNNYKKLIGSILRAAKNNPYEAYVDEYREAAEWIRIRLLIPYEMKKLKENGPIL